MEYIKGDITKVERGLVLHGTNCSGGFGSGVAGAIRKVWPEVYERFKDYTPCPELLGKFVPVRINDQLVVGNCYTQLNYGADGKKYASLDAISKSVTRAFHYATDKNIDIICLPKIGSGLGGLSWDEEVEPALSKIAEEFPYIAVKIYYID